MFSWYGFCHKKVIMTGNILELNQQSQDLNTQTSVVYHVGSFFSTHQTKKAQEGRLFCHKKRFTYTFIADGQVVAIHFDANKDQIYHLGHKVNIHQLTSNQKKHLAQCYAALKSQTQKMGKLFELFEQALGPFSIERQNKNRLQHL